MDAYLLSDLQQYLQQYPAAHYSHNGKEPLLYVVVLLLSLQFRWGAWGRWRSSRAAAGQPLEQHCRRHGCVGAHLPVRPTCLPPATLSHLLTCCPLLPAAAPWCRGAVAFLSREAATKDYRLDGVHLAICLQHYGVLDTSAADAGEGPALWRLHQRLAGCAASWQMCRPGQAYTGQAYTRQALACTECECVHPHICFALP